MIAAISCEQKASNSSADTNDSTGLGAMETEVLAIHDEVMPRMTEINKLSSQLRQIKASAGETEEGKPAVIEGLDEALQNLREAEQSMMDWMKEYGEGKEKAGPDGLKAFYEQELEKIKVVKANMLSSIDAANAWLAAHPAG